STYLDVYKFGAVLVREEDLEEYAMQALQKPAAPPAAVPEPLLNQPTPGQPALPAPGKTTVTEIPDGKSDYDKMLQLLKDAPSLRDLGVRVQAKVIDLVTKEQKDAYAAQMEADRTKWESKITTQLESHFDDE